jgi:hypothetical protein
MHENFGMGKPLGKQLFGRLKSEDNIKMHGSGSGLYLMVGFGVSDVETLGFATSLRMRHTLNMVSSLMNDLEHIQFCVFFIFMSTCH